IACYGVPLSFYSGTTPEAAAALDQKLSDFLTFESQRFSATTCEKNGLTDPTIDSQLEIAILDLKTQMDLQKKMGLDGPSESLACGKPISMPTGVMWHQLTDFVIAGRTPDTTIALTRTYFSKPYGISHEFGPNWVHNWETRIMGSYGVLATPGATVNL